MSKAREPQIQAAGAAQSRPDIEWQAVTSGRPDLVERYQNVMAEMDEHYAACDREEVARLMISAECQYYVGIGDGFEIVIGYQWDARRRCFQIRSTGFRGLIEPSEALLLLVDQLTAFLLRNRQEAVFGIIPRAMGNARIVQLHGLIPWTPHLRVTGGRHVGGLGVYGGTYWRIAPANGLRACPQSDAAGDEI